MSFAFNKALVAVGHIRFFLFEVQSFFLSTARTFHLFINMHVSLELREALLAISNKRLFLQEFQSIGFSTFRALVGIVSELMSLMFSKTFRAICHERSLIVVPDAIKLATVVAVSILLNALGIVDVLSKAGGAVPVDHL